MNHIRYHSVAFLCSALACSSAVAPEVEVESYRGHYWFGVLQRYAPTMTGRFSHWRTATTVSRRDAESAECLRARAGIAAPERLSTR